MAAQGKCRLTYAHGQRVRAGKAGGDDAHGLAGQKADFHESEQQVLILAFGSKKARVVREAIEGCVSHYVTLSALQLHEFGTVVLDEPAAFSITGIIPLIAGFIMAPLYPILNRWIPRRYLFTGGMVSMIIGYTMLALFSSNLPVVIVALIFFYVPAQFIQMTAILSLTDSIEYGQLKNGKRNEAVTLSVRPMLDKIGGAMSNGAVGAVALAAGMTGHATAADMTASNIATFKTFAFYVPLVLIILSLVVFWFKVKIDEKMHAQIVEELEAKLASGEIVDDEAQAVIKN